MVMRRSPRAVNAACLAAALLCVLPAVRPAAALGSYQLLNNFPYATGTTDLNLFGTAGSDDGVSAPIPLPKPFKFFNSTFASYWVSMNGAQRPAACSSSACAAGLQRRCHCSESCT